MQRVWLICSLALLLIASACGGAPATPPQEDALQTLGTVLDWDRSPAAVVVRLEMVGRTGDPLIDLNRLPFCTLFGDGHLVWTNEFSHPQEVLEDRLSEDQMRSFIQYVIGSGFYSWEQDSGLLPPTPAAGPSMVVPAITVSLYGSTRTLDAISNWPPGAFERLLEQCRTLSSTPVLYEPQGVWLSAVAAPPGADLPLIQWESDAAENPSDFDPAAATLDMPQWITGPLAAFAWRVARESSLAVLIGSTPYQFIVQDPAIQPGAPPAPQSGT